MFFPQEIVVIKLRIEVYTILIIDKSAMLEEGYIFNTICP